MFLCWVALQLWWRCNYSEYGTENYLTKENGIFPGKLKIVPKNEVE